ncbi:MAG: tetratricopeptide repeat protein [Bacteroidales bacterium]|nr:tetratricopeptide repeat protein [Bacteroidales bacterium]
MKPAIHILSFFTILILWLGPGRAMAQQTEEQLGVQYYQNKEYDKAMMVFEGLFEKNPSQFNYIYYINCIIELKDFEKAEKIIRKQARTFPNDPRFQIDMGYVYIMEGETQKGRKVYEESLKDLTADRSQVYNLANAFMNRRETDYAVRAYKRGRELFKDPSLFAIELSYLYESLGNSELLLDEYLNLLTSQPTQLSMVQNRLQSWLSYDTDNEKNDTFRKVLLTRTQQFPDEIIYAELLLWYSIQQKDFSLAFIQARALDRRYAESGQRIFDLAAMAVSNNNYAVAIEAYNYIIKKNADPMLVMESRVQLLNTEYIQYTDKYVIEKEKIALLGIRYEELLNELGKGPRTLPLIRNLAHLQAFYLDNAVGAVQLLEEAIVIPNSLAKEQAQCKLELADIYLFSGEQWEATLLYSQVEKAFKNEPLGHEAKLRNARLSFYIGEFDRARTQLDILKAATSKLIANDAMELSLMISDNIGEDSITIPLSMYAEADLFVFRNQYTEALAVLDSLSVLFPGHAILDDVIFKKAEILEKKGQFMDAANLYASLIKDYPFDLLGDDATFHLADLYESHLNEPAKAQQLFQDLMINYPGSLYVVEARKRFRSLRNDPVN